MFQDREIGKVKIAELALAGQYSVAALDSFTVSLIPHMEWEHKIC